LEQLYVFLHHSHFSSPNCSNWPVQEQAQKRPLILISGFIHDVGTFVDEHPGGPHLLIKFIGKDATTAFFGGVYDHSNAAHNVRFLSVHFSWHTLRQYLS
jgi:hypothetical protein